MGMVLTILSLPLTAQVVFEVEETMVDRNDTVEVEITTNNFMGVVGFNLPHTYDSTVLEYIDVINVNPDLGGLTAQGPGPGSSLPNGQMVVNWFDQSTETVDLPNGSTLFSIRFRGIGNDCDTSVVNITDLGRRKIEVLDENLDDLPFSIDSGFVAINGTDCESLPDVTFRLNQASGMPATEVCLQLQVDGFIDIENFQWSLKWDQSVATFSRVTNFNLPSLTAGKFNFDQNNDALLCIWDDDQGQAITVPNGTRIADICFNIVGMPGDMTDVFWSDSPLPLEVSRLNEPMPIGASTQSGKLTVTQPSSGDPIQMIVCDAEGRCGEPICVPVKVVNFVEINSFQFSMEIPNGVSVSDPNSRNHALPGFGTSKIANPQAGVVRGLWDDPQGGCQTLPDSTVLFEICLESTDEGVYDINMSNTPLRVEFLDCDDMFPDVELVGPGKLTVSCMGAPNVSVTLRDTLKVRCADRCRGFIDVNPMGGSGNYTIRWTEDGNPLSQFDDQTQASNLCGGNYRIIVCDATDPNNCDTLDVNLRKPELISVTETITPATSGCNGEILLNVQGGTPNYFFRWDPNANSQTTNPAIDLCKGKYNCTITDSENCTFITDSFTVTGAPIVLGEPMITEPDCAGDCDGGIDLVVSGGCGPLSYAWTVVSGMGTISNPNSMNQTGLCAGQYKVVVTDTAGGMAMSTITVNEPDPISVQLDSVQNGDSGFIFVSISGGTVTGNYVCKWTDSQGNLVGQNTDLGPVPPGTYIKMTTDDNGCMSVDTFTIAMMDLSVTINTSITAGGTNVSCNGECDGTADVIVSNGSGSYSYSWSHDPALTGASVSDLCADTYRVTVEDQISGATEVQSFVITEPDSLTATIVEMDCASGMGVRDGAYRAVPEGGSRPYNYLWCNNSTSSVPTNLEGGTLCNVLITDANGCQIFVDDIDICIDSMGPVDLPCFEGRDVITPNDDGMNDFLQISCTEDSRFADNELFIYNRRGQLIQQYGNYNNDWRGTDMDGNLVTEDAYMWVFVVTLSNGQNQVYRGTVTVLLN